MWTAVVLGIWLQLVVVFGQQQVLEFTSTPTKIAVIGAGSGGSSAAYYLQKYSSHGYDITIFEKSDYIGGRSTTVDALDDPKYPVELGGSVFVSANKILVLAVEKFNLTTKKFGEIDNERGDNDVAVWNGEQVVFTLDDGWFSVIKLVWNYGLAPFKAYALTTSFIKTFLAFFYNSHFPFPNLTELVVQAGFDNALNETGDLYLEDSGVPEKYSQEIIQAVTRVNYASNLDQIHGLGTLVGLAASGAVSVVGGNWRIFENFIIDSQAILKLNTTVTSIKKADGHWKVKYLENDQLTSEAFDHVIIAAPLNQTLIKGLDKKVTSKLPEVNYTELHVTLFSSKLRLSGVYFNESEIGPSVITTPTLNATIPFTSVSIVDYIAETGDFIYKIFSFEVIEDEFITKLFPPAFEVTWIKRKLWKSYPKLVTREEFGGFQIDDSLWYGNIIEPFISTMETSALAGANIAGLISATTNTTAIVVP